MSGSGITANAPGQGGPYFSIERINLLQSCSPERIVQGRSWCWKSELTGQLARVKADHAISSEI